MIYRMVLKIITKVPIEMPIFFEKITDRTSMPSIAPPNLIVSPLPIPEMTPPKITHSKRSEPASGDRKDTSIGNTFMIIKDISE